MVLENVTLPCFSALYVVREEEYEATKTGRKRGLEGGQPFSVSRKFLGFLGTTLTERITGKNCFAPIPREFDEERQGRETEREREAE